MTELTAPLEGKALPLSEVPDPIFAGGRLGDGVAIEPSNNTVVAPADAKVLDGAGRVATPWRCAWIAAWKFSFTWS